jgi:hypothetical protein
MTNPLSPAAQAVANAIEPLDWESGHCNYDDICFISRQVAATALRAAADQVLSEVDTMDTEEWIGQSAWQQAEQSVRFRFLAIAAELAGTTTTPDES